MKKAPLHWLPIFSKPPIRRAYHSEINVAKVTDLFKKIQRRVLESKYH
jgi:hypothetical protein